MQKCFHPIAVGVGDSLGRPGRDGGFVRSLFPLCIRWRCGCEDTVAAEDVLEDVFMQLW